MRRLLLLVLALGVLTEVLARQGVGAAQAVRTQTCALPFHVATALVRLHCRGAGAVGGREIEAATRRLVAIGAVAPQTLQGVTIAWCPLPGIRGIAPDAGHIFLDDELRASAAATLLTLAHETVHIRQYREAPGGAFECAYIVALAACRGCQDRRHPLERPAFELEDRVRRLAGI